MKYLGQKNNNKQIYIPEYGTDFRGGGSTGQFMYHNYLIGVIESHLTEVGFQFGFEKCEWRA